MTRRRFTFQERFYIAKRDGFRCKLCGKKLKHKEWVLDHKIPLSKGGIDEYSNLQLLCDKCDKEKADTILPKYAEEYVSARLNYLIRQNENRINMLLHRKCG